MLAGVARQVLELEREIQQVAHVVFGGILRAVDDGLPDPKVRILRARVVGDGTVQDTLTITSHVADPVSTEVRLRLVPEFAPLQEVKAGLATAREWKLSRDDATATTLRAIEHAVHRRTAVVLAIPYDLAAVASLDDEAADVDTWADLRDLRDRPAR